MEIDEEKKPPQTTVVLTGRRKPRPKRMSEALTDFMNQETTESYGKLLQSTGESPSTDKVDLAGDLVIHFIDIGQGNCTFIECPGGETILIDCGTTSTKTTRAEVAKLAGEYIKSRLTKNTLDYLVISHPDKDHMNKVKEVLEGVTPTKILLGGNDPKAYGGGEKTQSKEYLQAHVPGGKLENAFINEGNFYSETPSTPEKERLIQCKHGLEVFIVSANAANVLPSTFKETLNVTGVETLTSGQPPNTGCVVLCFRYQKRQILICGDATFSTEFVMLESEWKHHLKSDALEGGHHGSADSFSDAFLEAVSPSWIHFSADNRGTFRHPTWEAVQRVIRCCPGVVGTADYGPHGIVIGPKSSVGLEHQENKKELIRKTPRVAQVLQVMQEKALQGKPALQSLLKGWFEEGEWKQDQLEPLKPIKEEWVGHLLYDCIISQSMDTPLVDYWGRHFDLMADEEKRITALTGWEDEKYYWDWAAIDFNLFTTLVTANLGVYWLLTVTREGDLFTDLA